MFLIEINTENAAFDAEAPEFETARILRELADRLERNRMPGEWPINLRDVNGNSVGTAKEV